MKPHRASAKKPSAMTSLFAALGAFLHAGGSRAPKTSRRLILSVPAVTLAALACSAAPALADTAPSVTIEPASAVAYTTAHVSGTVNPNGGPSATAWIFEYSKNPVGEGWTPAGGGEFTGAEAKGKSPVAVQTTLEGLQPNTTYQARLVATNAGGETISAQPNPSFTTNEVAKPTVTSAVPSAITGTTAHFTGTVNPNAPGASPGQDPAFNTSWHFECTPECPGLEGGQVLADNSAHEVTADGKGLVPTTIYTVTLVASNLGGQSTAGPVTFTTPAAPPTIESEFVTNVASGSATFNAQINPGGADTKYRFEYDTSEYSGSAAHGESVPVPEGDAGGGTAGVVLSVHVQQRLLPNTTYHFRVVATSALEPTKPVDGEDRSFTTQLGGLGFALPDGRAWEMVSPANKFGARLEPITNEGGVIQASEDGTAITYVADAPIVANPPGNSSLQVTQVVSARSPTAWSSRDIATPNESADGVFVGHLAEYLWFSPNLSLGLVQPHGATPLSPEASEKTIYLREPLAEEASETYLPLVTAGNVPPGTGFGYHLEFVSATPDLSHVVIQSGVALTPTAGEFGLYEWSARQLHLVNVLPSGEPASNGFLGDNSHDVRHAISSDGSRVVWFSHEKEGKQTGHLYMRDMTKGETVQLDAVEPGAEGGEGEPTFQTASQDGSKVFFTDSQKLTPDSTASFPSKRDLYEFEVTSGNGPLAGKLTDVTVDKNAGESAAVQGVLPGVSEDGSYVYFVANGVLSNTENTEKEKAAPGHCEGESSPSGATCNLYVSHHEGGEWKTTFIAGLSGEDAHDWEVAFKGELNRLTSRVSPGGRYFAFMSDRSLTGYDNVDANSPPTEPHPDEEVFLYDASSARLACASCNPTGARPVGVLDKEEAGEGLGLLVDRPEVWKNRWLAGSIPGWTAAEQNRALYQSRYLSDSGRLFFNSADALVPRDTNGKEDVYQYEPDGVGGCESAGGCVALISSGTSGSESAFLDASVSGNDVFFLTASDTGFDVYDAHVCSPSSPCFAQSAVPPPACTTGDSCRQPPSPQPSIFGAPASATFSGVGNLTPPGSTPVKPNAAQVNAEKLVKALKACRAKHNKHKRASCEAQARKKYGAKKKAKKANRHTKKGRT